MKKHYLNLLVCFFIVIFVRTRINSQNSPPTFISTPITSVFEDHTYIYEISTDDQDFDIPTVTASTLPGWLSLISYNVSTHAGSSYGYMDGPTNTALFKTASGIITNNLEDLYITDWNYIRKIDFGSGSNVSTIAGNVNAGFVDGTGTQAKFSSPSDICYDKNNDVFYIADTDNNSIRKMTSSGVVTTLAGSGIAGFVNGNGTSAQFDGPLGITMDNLNSVIYVSDTKNNVIRKITLSGDVTTFAGSGIQGFADGSSTTAKFHLPNKLVVDNIGSTIYVADNYRIRKIDTFTGNVTTLAGSGQSGHTDGQGSSAKFGSLGGITFDTRTAYDKFIYVSDWSKIRRINMSTGDVTTIAGTSMGYLDGPGANAQFNGVGGMIYSFPYLYIVDGGTKIRKIYMETTLKGDPSGLAGQSFPVVLNANDGNGGSTNQNFTITVNSTLGIDKNIIKGFALYPNPVEDILNIKTQENINNIKIFNPLGQQIVNKNANTNKMSFNINYLPKGIYFVIVNTNKTIKSVEIMKQ